MLCESDIAIFAWRSIENMLTVPLIKLALGHFIDNNIIDGPFKDKTFHG